MLMKAAEDEDVLAETCNELAQKKSSLRETLASAAAEAYATHSQHLVGAHSGLPLSASVPALAEELRELADAKASLLSMQKVQSSIRMASIEGCKPTLVSVAFAADCLAKAAAVLRSVREHAQTEKGAIPLMPGHLAPPLQVQLQQVSDSVVSVSFDFAYVCMIV